MSHPSLQSAVFRTTKFLLRPPLALEVTLWLLLAGAVVGIRLYLWHLLPVYFWSDDAISYAYSAFHWLDTGEMIFDGRRGPTYTLFIAAALKIFGTINGVIWLQHALGALAILAATAVGRLCWGRAAILPLFICGLALALYGLPLHMEHLIRNESLLLIFSVAAFGAWWLALRSDQPAWLFVAGLTTTLLTMTKNVFVVFPFVLVVGILLYSAPGWRPRLWRLALLFAGLGLPYGALKIHESTSRIVPQPEPQAGLLFFGRTAQWTKLDGGIEPELKELIRADIEEYRHLPKLDNNIILKRTAVPHLWRALRARGKTPTDLDRLCRNFAIEAIRSQPEAWARQIRNDLWQLHFHSGVRNTFPTEKMVGEARQSLVEARRQDDLHPTMESDRMDAVLAAHSKGSAFRPFHRLLNDAWLFQAFPILLTTLAFPILVLCTRGKIRFFFCGMAAVWFSNMVLLSTVGRPLDRYLMPLVPLMFWSMSGVILLVWNWMLHAVDKLLSPAHPIPAQLPARPV